MNRCGWPFPSKTKVDDTLQQQGPVQDHIIITTGPFKMRKEMPTFTEIQHNKRNFISHMTGMLPQ
jgi:hypothetical protein